VFGEGEGGRGAKLGEGRSEATTLYFYSSISNNFLASFLSPQVKRIKALFPAVTVIVDGGVNAETIKSVVSSGADVIVSGSYVFKHPGGVGGGVKELVKVGGIAELK